MLSDRENIFMECRPERIVEFFSDNVFVGEIAQTPLNESVLTDGKVDISKLNGW